MTSERAANLFVVGFWVVVFWLLGIALHNTTGAHHAVIWGVWAGSGLVLLASWRSGYETFAILGFWAVVFVSAGIAAFSACGSGG